MKKLLALFSLALLMSACDKDDCCTNEEMASPCEREMYALFKDRLECREDKKDGQVVFEMANHIFKGEYEGQTVYFVDTICPNCAVAPPEFGYTCEKEKVEFEDFRMVSNRQKVFDACENAYVK